MDSTIQEICGICQRNISKYLCPKCQLPYCSLKCYRHSDHDCQHVFRRESLKETLSRMTVDEGERKRTLAILEKFQSHELNNFDDEEEKNENSLDEVNSETGESPFSLLKSLEKFDLETANVDDLWNQLTERERHEFIRSLETGDNRIISAWEPWWMKHDPIILEITNSIETVDDPHRAFISNDIKPLSRQKFEKIPKELVFNLMEIICSFSYLCRWFNGPLNEFDMTHLAGDTLLAICRTLATNEPFLFEGLIPFLDEWSYRLITDGPCKSSESIFRRSVEDACLLLKSRQRILRSLSELRDLCLSISTSSPPHRLAERKIHFYQCWLFEAYDFLNLSGLISQTQDYLASRFPLTYQMKTTSNTT